MRAALIHSTGTLWLAGDPDTTERLHSSAGNLRIDGRTAVQADARVRAAATLHLDRRNLATTVSFDTSRIFSTPAEAEVWSGMYDTVSPRTGTLVLECVAPAGLAWLNFPGAVVQPPRRQVIGCSVLLGYEILAGAPVEVTYASGTVTLSTPLAGDTLDLFGVVFTASNLGSPTPPLWNKTAAGLAAAINATASINSIVTAAADGSTVTITSILGGTVGNEITLATNAPARVILSGETLSGGVGVTTQVPLW